MSILHTDVFPEFSGPRTRTRGGPGSTSASGPEGRGEPWCELSARTRIFSRARWTFAYAYIGVSSELYSVDGVPVTCATVHTVSLTTKSKTHLDRTTLPGEDGCLAFVAEEIVFTLSKLCAEYFSKTFQKLGVALVSIEVPFVCPTVDLP